MNKKELQTGKSYREWTDITNDVRTELNKYRKKPEKDPFKYVYPIPDFTKEDSKFKVGDMVHYKLDEPRNSRNVKQSGKFRMADYRFSPQATKIVKVLDYPPPIRYRYMLNGIPNASYTEAQLKLAKNQNEAEKYFIKKIIGKRKVKGKIEYLCWWRGYKKATATWQPKEELLEDQAQDYIKEYEDSL